MDNLGCMWIFLWIVGDDLFFYVWIVWYCLEDFVNWILFSSINWNIVDLLDSFCCCFICCEYLGHLKIKFPGPRYCLQWISMSTLWLNYWRSCCSCSLKLRIFAPWWTCQSLVSLWPRLILCLKFSTFWGLTKRIISKCWTHEKAYASGIS